MKPLRLEMKLIRGNPERGIYGGWRVTAEALGNWLGWASDINYESSRFPQMCDDEFREQVSLPKGTKVIDVVFSKTATPDSFAINSHGSVKVGEKKEYKDGAVEEHYTALFAKGTIIVRELYRRGYRFVRVEY